MATATIKDEVKQTTENIQTEINSSAYIGRLKPEVDPRDFLDQLKIENEVLYKVGKVRFRGVTLSMNEVGYFNIHCHKSFADYIRSRREVLYFRCEHY